MLNIRQSQMDTMAAASAGTQMVAPCPDTLTDIEILVRDEDDNPVTNVRYKLVLTDGTTQFGELGSDGRIFVASLLPGSCDIQFLEMFAFGVPQAEINRSWDWNSSQGDAAEHANALDFDDSGAQTLTEGSQGEADASKTAQATAEAGSAEAQPADSENDSATIGTNDFAEDDSAEEED